MNRTTLATLAFLAASLAAGPSTSGCGDPKGPGGERVVLDVRIAPADVARSFRTTTGWDVVLTRAELVTGPIYFYEAVPSLSRGRSPWLGIRSAHAHPGHEGHDEARGELLAGRRVDLLGGAFVGRGAGLTGQVRSATLFFGGSGADEVLAIEGRATKEGATRAFRTSVTAAALGGADAPTSVENCPFGGTEIDGDGVVSIVVGLEGWLDPIDFAEGLEGAQKERLVRGMKVGAAYEFRYSRP
jgi:hypothetical protein